MCRRLSWPPSPLSVNVPTRPDPIASRPSFSTACAPTIQSHGGRDNPSGHRTAVDRGLLRGFRYPTLTRSTAPSTPEGVTDQTTKFPQVTAATDAPATFAGRVKPVRVLIGLRISYLTDESTSLERQLFDARKYIAERAHLGWVE